MRFRGVLASLFSSDIDGRDEKYSFAIYQTGTVGEIWRRCPGVRRGRVHPEKLGGGVQPASQNPYPIYDQNLRHSLPYL